MRQGQGLRALAHPPLQAVLIFELEHWRDWNVRRTSEAANKAYLSFSAAPRQGLLLAPQKLLLC